MVQSIYIRLLLYGSTIRGLGLLYGSTIGSGFQLQQLRGNIIVFLLQLRKYDEKVIWLVVDGTLGFHAKGHDFLLCWVVASWACNIVSLFKSCVVSNLY